MHLKHRQTCRVCGNRHLAPVIDLGEQYLQGSFVKEGWPTPSRRKIPTALVRCDTSKDENACGLVQMSVTTPPEVLYRSYWYQSSISATMREHLRWIVSEVMGLIHRDCPYSELAVCDLACNDGQLLSHYPREIHRTGVDPSNIARTAQENAPGAVIINDLFPTRRLDPGQRFDAVSTIAMLYDIEDPVTFIRAVESHLKDDGIWVVEVAYLPATLRQVSLDTVVHEHLMYYSLATLERVITEAGLRVFRAETNDINGGSIQVYCSKAHCTLHDRPEWTEALGALRTAEFDLQLDAEEPYRLFRSQCDIVKHELTKLVRDIRGRGQTLALYGSSTKSNTLIQFLGLTREDIPYALERSPAKWGAKTLGTDIPIISEEEGRARSPDFLLVGPWHFREEILQREKDWINGTNGRNRAAFIFALPKLEVVTSVA